MNEYIDIYCERLAPGLLAEPLNALTNLSFIIAAFFVFRLTKAQQKFDAKTKLLIFLLLAIGTGSASFHTLATKAAMLADVLPILLFQIAFIWLYALDVMKINALRTSLLFLAFMVCTITAEQIPAGILNGSLSYAPAFLFLSGFALWHWKNARVEKYTLVAAVLAFLLSLTFRSIDMALCPSIAIGTHFLWHLLNGLVLYLCARTYILARNSCYTDPRT